MADLEARGYVDDRAFAAAWAESRARGRSFGRQRLQEELRARGVARPLVEAAIDRAFEDTSELARAQACRGAAAGDPPAPRARPGPTRGSMTISGAAGILGRRPAGASGRSVATAGPRS